MRFADFSPGPSPSVDQRRDALSKGLGRAMQWAEAGTLDEETLLEACLHDRRYDGQVEDSRGDWLWRLIRLLDAADRLRVPILHGLYELSEEWSAGQLCELAFHYAEGGDDEFRRRLYEIVERKPIADRGWLGEEEILRLDGEPAFLFAARVRGDRLSGGSWAWEDEALSDRAVELFGDAKMRALLDDSADPAIRAYREARDAGEHARKSRKPSLSHREKMRAITVDQILSAAESGGLGFGYYRGWGKFAEDADLAAVFRHLSGARDPKVIAALLQVFSARPALQFAERFLDLCVHPDPDVRFRATLALQDLELPSIREFALTQLEAGVPEEFIRLFTRNYRPGDERRILEAVEIPEDDGRCHGLLMNILRILETNPGADVSRLGVVVYASTPCENCRSDAALLLRDRGVAPGWLAAECRLDSNGDTRGLFAEVGGP